MKRSRFTEQQIAFALQQAEQGTQVAEVTRKRASASRPFTAGRRSLAG
jgi:putative transposase